MKDRTGWRSLVEWAIAFGLLAFTLIGAMSIGMFVAPFAIAAFIVAARRNQQGPEAAYGALIGVGAICLFIAYGNRAYSPCPTGEVVVHLQPGEQFISRCGGSNPLPWLTIGVLLVAAGLGRYLVARRAHRGAGT